MTGPTSTQKPSQRYFHLDSGDDVIFDPETLQDLYDIILSYLDTLFDFQFIGLTSTFIFQEENTENIYAQYRFGSDQIQVAGDKKFDDEIEYLSSKYKIYLTGDESAAHTSFSIYKAFDAFYNEDSVNKMDEALEQKPMSELFEEGTEKYDPQKNDFTHESLSKIHLDNFSLAEGTLVLQTVPNINLKTAEYLPVPIIAFGHLTGMIYIIYDKSKLVEGRIARDAASQKAIGDLLNQRPILMRLITREYEQIVNEYEQTFYGARPKMPLFRYHAIFKDLRDKSRSRTPINRYLKQYVNKQELQNIPSGIINSNSFLKSYNYDRYYKKRAANLIKQSEKAVEESIKRLSAAITSIIVDSFAHNVGAHSLVALKWWFENRFKMMDDKFEFDKLDLTKIHPGIIYKDLLKAASKENIFHQKMSESESAYDPLQISLLDVIRFMPKEVQDQFLSISNERGLVGRLPVPVDHGIAHFLQYLRDKSAFWSGAARDQVFGARIKSWSDILKEFLNNTLFLGSVAHSEGVNKLNVYIEIVDPKTKKIKFGGEYARIDLSIMNTEKFEKKGKKSKSPQKIKDPVNSFKIDPLTEMPEYSGYAFLRQGADFKTLYPEIEKLPDVFLPNGVIGQHALYTILENTLRNIKHYNEKPDAKGEKSVRAIMKKQGLNLVISIEEAPFYYPEPKQAKFKATDEYSLFKVSTWLHHPQNLVNKDGTKLNWINQGKKKVEDFGQWSSVLNDHTQQLQKRIVDKAGQAILGGSAQDKVCAAMLMNNRFISIEYVDERKSRRQYYPFVIPATEKFTSIEKRYSDPDFTVEEESLHKMTNLKLQQLTRAQRRAAYIHALGGKDGKNGYLKNYKTKKGLIKKSCYLWKGEKCKFLDGNFNGLHDNVSRFMIVVVDLASYTHSEQEANPGKQYSLKELRTDAIDQYRQAGILRIVFADKKLKDLQHQLKSASTEEKKKITDSMHEYAMLLWMEDWFAQEETDRKIGFQIRRAGSSKARRGSIAYFKRDPDKGLAFEYFSAKSLKRKAQQEFLKSDLGDQEKDLPTLVIQHGSSKGNKETIVKIRNHCSLVTDYCGYGSFKDGSTKLLEVDFNKGNFEAPIKALETFLTRITVIDNRIHDRLKREEAEPNPFRDMLRIQTFPEERGKFRAYQNAFREKDSKYYKKGGHFFIMHLSHLESILKPSGERYTEKDVTEFFENEIQAVVKKAFGYFPTNYLFVITSGRGRSDWLEDIKHPQITFRPIEDLVNAIEDGLALKDDFQVKYNLCNVLFGS